MRKRVCRLLFSVICLTVLFSGKVFAENNNWSPIYFDASGKVSFETVYGVAVSVGFKTLGWTIKQYDLSKDNPENRTITCMLHYETYIGEDGIDHTFYYLSRDELLQKAGQVSQEWCNELRHKGGTVYMDSIMTVTYYDWQLGNLYEDGSYDGEIYFTFEGISTARAWGDPESMRQSFDRALIIEPDPEVETLPKETEQNTTQAETVTEKPTIYFNPKDYKIVGTH